MEINLKNKAISLIIPYFCFCCLFYFYIINSKKLFLHTLLLTIRFDRDLLSLSHAISCVNSKYSTEKFRSKTREDRKNHSQWINKEIRCLTPNYSNYLFI